MTNEAQTPTHIAVEEYKALFKDYDDFWTMLTKQYSGESAALVISMENRRVWKERGISFVLGAIASGLVAFIIG